MTIDVVIPTWRRPAPLRRCLEAILRQTRPPTRVIVAVKRGDAGTVQALEQFSKEQSSMEMIRVVVEDQANFRDQLAAGLCASKGEVIAFTDDDAEPRPDWIERLIAYYSDSSVVGVGGRDWQPYERWNEPVVGTISWYGRVVGNHHLGCGPAREVDLLKGVNWSFRGDIVRQVGFDSRLKGKGNVTHTEMMLCFELRRMGFKLIYDPAIAVDHHVEPRQDGDVNARGGFERQSYIDSVHNETLAMLTHLCGARRIAYRAWSALIGTIGTPGLLQTVRRIIKRKDSPAQALARYRAVREGVRTAHQTWRSGDAPAAGEAGAACVSRG